MLWRCRLLCAGCCVAILWLFGTASAATESEPESEFNRVRVEEVIASPEDVRSYRTLIYNNGLQVLLVQDPAVTEADWALSVLAGTNQDPVGLPGLNRLLALLLYGDLAADIQVRPEHTEYRMQTPTAELADALTHFVAQLDGDGDISVEGIDRAQHLLASSIRSGLGATLAARREDVFSALFNAKHPMARRPGTSASIAQLPVVKEALQNNYSRLYVPARMRFALVADIPLEQQQQLVVAALSPLANTAAESTRHSGYPPLFSPQALPMEVHIQAEIAKPQLQLLFPVPNPLALYAEKPLAEVSRLLADGGPGSLLSLLKDLGWAEAIDAGMGMQSRYDGLYEVRIDLTDLGVRAQKQMVALVFYMLDQIRNRGLREWRHEELARIAALNFRYRDASAIRDPAQLAYALHHYRPRDVLYGRFRYHEFNERLARRYLDFLRSDNVLVSLTSKNSVADEQRSPMLLTPYSVAKLEETQPDIKVAVRRRLSLPERNYFIPTRLSAKAAPMLPTSQKTGINEVLELFNKPRLRAWFSRAQVTRPVASVLLRLEIPAVGQSASAAAKAEIMAELIRQQLNEETFAAHLAGANFSLTPHSLGVDFEVHGYSPQLGLMLKHIDQVLDQVKITEREVLRAQRTLIEQLTTPSNTLAKLLHARLDPLHYRPSWSRSERAEALAGITPEQLRDFKHSRYRVARLNIVFFGNLYRQEAQRLAALSEHYFVENDPPAPQAAIYGRLESADGLELVMPSTEAKGIALYLQGQQGTAADHAQMQLAAQLLRESLAQAQKPGPETQNIADQYVIDRLESSAAATGNSGDSNSQKTATKAAAEQAHGVTQALITDVNPAQVAVLDWSLAGQSGMVVYYDLAAPNVGSVAEALRAFVRQELNRRWSSAEVASAKNIVAQKRLNAQALDLRAQSRTLWHELVDAAIPDAALQAAVAQLTAASTQAYRETLAKQVGGALIVNTQAGPNAPAALPKELHDYWSGLKKQWLNGPVLP